VLLVEDNAGSGMAIWASLPKQPDATTWISSFPIWLHDGTGWDLVLQPDAFESVDAVAMDAHRRVKCMKAGFSLFGTTSLDRRFFQVAETAGQQA
jgi:hypothetical protein